MSIYVRTERIDDGNNNIVVPADVLVELLAIATNSHVPIEEEEDE